MEGDANYFSRRANDERAAAMKAADARARRAHLKLAELYAKQASRIALPNSPIAEQSEAS